LFWSQDDPYTDAGSSSNRTQRPGVPGSAASSFLFNPSAHASRQGSPRGSHQPFEVAEGAIVEANYRRTGTWYPGTVTRDRCVCRSSTAYPPLPPLAKHPFGQYLRRIGSALNDVFFPFPTLHVFLRRYDGTWDIKYDDGEEETYVEEEHIRRRPSKPAAVGSHNIPPELASHKVPPI
jgi:hypothetical protein